MRRLLCITLLLALAACSTPGKPAGDAYIRAIENIRPVLGLPDLPLKFAGDTSMGNSPDGQWPVAAYEDTEGRKYYVEKTTARVVEIDGRALLAGHAPTQPAAVGDALRKRAETIVKNLFPNFASMQSRLTYEEGQKGDNHFFTWRDDSAPASFNRPFLQLAFQGQNGQLFAYYNTLTP
ncbi:MAG: hypothetical protein ACM3QS_17510 [Bacteroidota bacterium]